MCGFLGWFRPSTAPWSVEERGLQSSALARITHRGPDDGSESLGDGWWMGFRRLSILDLSDHGRQPMRFGAGRYTLTFNGEIYNFRELRATLGDAQLGSTGDTAVLGALIERYGIDSVLPRLRGMFAIAWRDAADGSLVIARDHFGIKPLYYRVASDDGLIYGSELRAVQRISGDSAINPSALADFFRWGAVQAPETMFAGIRCLPPGHLLRWKNGRMEVQRWFTPEWAPRGGKAIAKEEVRDAVIESVRTHLVADVPVGVFLSGGLDSTMMVACMRAAGQGSIKAFSIGYEENVGVPDESDAARRSAEFFGCEFTRERLTADSLEQKLDAYFDAMDQPTGDALNTWLVCGVAAQDVKVALSGLGADEWWAGYNYHRLIALAQKSPFRFAGGLARGLDKALPAVLRGHKAWKAAFYAFGGAGADVAHQQAHARTIIPPVIAPDLRIESAHWLDELLLRETQTYLANMLLRDNDWTSMAHSLELRVPLVDTEIFSLAGRVAPEAKLNASGGKRILREAFREMLPPWIYEDKAKKTFTLPLMKWMRLPKWRERILDTLHSQACRERGLLDPARVEALCSGYFANQNDSKQIWHLSQPVWMLYLLEEWARRHTSP
ncbi:MAG: asparagine synthase (glutamine-hydrolyzing) [Verrucomicrobiaceae bacterium]|nr:asparagine synthase (glutamine-hydrolyzing) [Verrucomicrobiaceae bacterium]